VIDSETFEEGKAFASIEIGLELIESFAQNQGFSIVKKSDKSKNEGKGYYLVRCSRALKPRNWGSASGECFSKKLMTMTWLSINLC
jgi:hypothetical protein